MCQIEFDGDVEVEGYRARDRKARKLHRCDLCRGIIQPGETYEYASWICDREPDWQKLCAPCAKDMGEFNDEHHVVIFAGQFLEYLEQCIDEDDEENAKWIPMRDRIQARQEAAKAARMVT